MISGTTQIIGLVGHPIGQVKMPGFLNPYFEAVGKDVALVPFDVPPEALLHYMALLRQGVNLLGSLVTVPHKQACSRHVDHLSDRATALGAVNVVRREADGSLHGDHVDGFGFLNAARAHGFTAAGKNALVVGVGGAGSAIAYALCEVGITLLCILDIDAGRLDRLKQVLNTAFPTVDVQTRCADVSAFDLVLNATAVGMLSTDPLPLPAEQMRTLKPGTLVGDVVTSPAMTPFLTLAQAVGCQVQTGAEMAKASMEFVGSFLKVMPHIDPALTVMAPLPSVKASA